jgi:CPA2 family monovalent cation:H+ antiporter-2
MRTRYARECADLHAAGAKDVVAEEVEAGVEVLARLLRWLEVPRNVIEDRVHEARVSTQTSARRLVVPRSQLGEGQALAELKIESVLLAETSPGTGNSPISLDLRRKTGALVVALRRGDRLLQQPDPKEPFATGDVVFLVGDLPAIARAVELLVGVHPASTPP